MLGAVWLLLSQAGRSIIWIGCATLTRHHHVRRQ
jgi:hypothetical protein